MKLVDIYQDATGKQSHHIYLAILYVYKVWQDKYDERESLGVNFLEDIQNVICEINMFKYIADF